MFKYMILLFTLVPAVELYFLILVGQHIGPLNTIFLIILTGVTGASLARQQGFACLQNIQRSMEQGIMPTDPMLDGVIILAGGLMLLTPGFLTDIAGFLLLIPYCRGIIKNIITQRLGMSISGRQTRPGTTIPPQKPRDFEDAEFRD